jgi:dTDP-4-amino-4,6-dideoxygalactose transaminase
VTFSKPLLGSPSEAGWLVPLSDIEVDDKLLGVVRETVASGWWSMGPRVEEFERAFREFSGARHAFAVASGTAALHLALVACECGPGDEVILPSLNFVAAANTIRHAGATPVFCDISGPGNLNLDPGDVGRRVTPATRAVVVLHYGGFPCDMRVIAEIAQQHGLVVIEDAAHAPGATLDGSLCGRLGRVGCFSFFSNKNLPIGEGGMVVTDDDEVAERIRLLRSHGMTTLTWDRHRGHAASYDVVACGFNYRMDELRAALGLVQLERLEEGNAARARLAAAYRGLLDGEAGIELPFSEPDPTATSAHHLAVALLPEDVNRNHVRASLHGNRIQTSVHYPPIHHFSFYAGAAPGSLPVTDAVAGRLLTLPLYPRMTEMQAEVVAEALRAAVAEAR